MPVADIRVALGDLDKCCHIECDLNADILCMNTTPLNIIPHNSSITMVRECRGFLWGGGG